MPYIKGKTNLQHIRGLQHEGGASSSTTSAESVGGSMQTLASATDKPWRHQKKEKREKLRRKFAHLDQH